MRLCGWYVRFFFRYLDTALLEIFGGEVTEITRGTENRYAFLHFATQEQAEAALSKNDIQIGGRKLC